LYEEELSYKTIDQSTEENCNNHLCMAASILREGGGHANMSVTRADIQVR
jgi:hypothetical protein